MTTNLHLHPRQGEAYLSQATEILFGGAAGGGKSHLERVAAILWCCDIPGLQVYFFRRTYPELVRNHLDGPGSFHVLLGEMVREKFARIVDDEIRFWNGSKIHLCHCQHAKDVYGYQGAEMHVLIIDELTQWLGSMYKFLRSRVRLGGLVVPERFKGLFPRILCGANPGGIGHNFVKASWIDIAKPRAISQMPKAEGGMLRQFIPSLLEDNPTMLVNDPDYESRLEGLGDATLVKAMRHGNWNIVSGGALDDVWSDRIVVPRFAVPFSWAVDRSLDWGSSHPFSVLWNAEADGTEAKMPDGSKWCPPRGSIIVAHEWYGTRVIGSNEGLKMPAPKVAKGIVEIDEKLIADKWIPGKPNRGPADNQIRDVRQPGTPTIEQEFESEGVYWAASDKSPGSRKIGLELLRGRIVEASKDHPEKPGLYFMDHCVGIMSRLPVLPRDPKNPDDVDTAAEDHDYDSIRYRVLQARRAVMSLSMGTAN